MNPYLLLGVKRDAGDAAIRRAYLEAIREATPDTHPVRFQALTEAYNVVRDDRSRCRHELFHQQSHGDSPMDVALRHWRLARRPKPLSLESMKSFLKACAKT